jgi:hypothetical protein
MTKGVKIWLKNLAVCLFFRRFENRLYRASINSNQPYRWVAKHGVDTQAIVCSNHWDEDLSWTIFSRHPVVVYSKSIKSSPNYVKYNKAQEAISYLNYIVDRYDFLPEYSIFVHGHRGSKHQDNFIDVIINRLEFDKPIINLNSSGLYDYVEEGDDYADKKYSWLSDNWGKLFGNDLVLPRRVGFYAHAQFAVHRDCIWQYKKEFWLNLYEWCKDSQLSNYVASRVFEYTWYYIFSKNPVFR